MTNAGARRVCGAGEEFARIPVAVLRMSLEIDLCHDGRRKIAALVLDAPAVAKQAQGVLSDIPPRAPPFDDEEKFVGDRRKQSRLNGCEDRRAINDHAIVAFAQLADEVSHLFDGTRWVEPIAGYLKVVEADLGNVPDRICERSVLQTDDSSFTGVVALANGHAPVKVDADQEHTSPDEAEISREAPGERGFPFTRNAGADQDRFRVAWLGQPQRRNR